MRKSCCWKSRSFCREKKYLQESDDFDHLFDKQTNFFRIPDRNGIFPQKFDKNKWAGIYTEGNAWTYRFGASQNVEKMIDLFGGTAIFCEALDEFMNNQEEPWFYTKYHELYEHIWIQEAGFGQLSMENQPTNHVLYLYVAAGCPRNGYIFDEL